MTTPFSEAYREALASVPFNNPIVETLAIEHPDEDTLYIVKDFSNFEATLETLLVVEFLAGFFKLKQPSKNSEGVPELQISMGNADGVVGAYLKRVKHSEKPIEAVFRPYLADDNTAPAMDPPLRLQIKSANVTLFQAQGRATFARDLKNTMIPKERYTLERFPGLGG